MPGKDLALFTWRPERLPDPQTLVCRSMFAFRGGAMRPEFDRFGLFAWDEALAHVGRNLARVLQALRPDLTHGPADTGPIRQAGPEPVTTPARGRSPPARR